MFMLYVCAKVVRKEGWVHKSLIVIGIFNTFYRYYISCPHRDHWEILPMNSANIQL